MRLKQLLLDMVQLCLRGTGHGCHGPQASGNHRQSQVADLEHSSTHQSHPQALDCLHRELQCSLPTCPLVALGSAKPHMYLPCQGPDARAGGRWPDWTSLSSQFSLLSTVLEHSYFPSRPGFLFQGLWKFKGNPTGFLNPQCSPSFEPGHVAEVGVCWSQS